MFKCTRQKNTIKTVVGKCNEKLETWFDIWFNNIKLPLSLIHLHMLIIKACNYHDCRPLSVQCKDKKALIPCVWLFCSPVQPNVYLMFSWSLKTFNRFLHDLFFFPFHHFCIWMGFSKDYVLLGTSVLVRSPLTGNEILLWSEKMCCVSYTLVSKNRSSVSD